MEIVQLPVGRSAWRERERLGFQAGAGLTSHARPFRVVAPGARLDFCATCAAPIEFGAVVRGRESFCSVECSLGGRPA